MSIRQAIIYGSNGGIGSAIAKKFLENNYNLCLFSRNELKLTKNITELKQLAPNLSIKGCSVDVCNVKSIESSFRYLKDESKFPVNHLILCQGINKDNLLIRETESNINQIIGTNLISSLNICKEYYRLMLSSRNSESSIVLIGKF